MDTIDLRLLFCSNIEGEAYVDELQSFDIPDQIRLGQFLCDIINDIYPELAPRCRYAGKECHYFYIIMRNFTYPIWEDLNEALNLANLHFNNKRLYFYRES